MGNCLEADLYAGFLFSILFLVSAVPRGQDSALLWDATMMLMRRDLDSEVVEGADDGPCLLQLLPRVRFLASLAVGRSPRLYPLLSFKNIPKNVVSSHLPSTLWVYSF